MKKELKLEYFSYTSGGGMRGGREEYRMYVKDEQTIIEIKDSPTYNVPPRKERYVLPKDAMDGMTEISVRNKMYRWKHLLRMNIRVLDAPSVDVSLRFSDGTEIRYERDSILPKYGVTSELMECMNATCRNDNTPCVLVSSRTVSEDALIGANVKGLRHGYLDIELFCKTDGEHRDFDGSYKVYSQDGALLYECGYEKEEYHTYVIHDRYGIPVTIDLNPCGKLCGTYVVEIMGTRMEAEIR